MSIIIITLVVSVVLAFAIGLGLGFFQEKFKVERDPKIDKIKAALPGANCGACGFPGCDAYANAVFKGEDPSKCTSGGKKTAEDLAAILGVAVTVVDKVAVLLCQGTRERAPEKGDYVGIKTCTAAKLSAGGTKLCAWGCLSYGDCESVCAFDAIHVRPDGIPHVDFDNCTGCGQCVKACPQKILTLVPKDRKGAVALCSNRNVIKAMVRKTCSVGCFKCELCVKSCPQKAIKMENGTPVVDYSLCDSCNVCVEKCPSKVFKLLEKGVFDEAAAPAAKEPAAV